MARKEASGLEFFNALQDFGSSFVVVEILDSESFCQSRIRSAVCLPPDLLTQNCSFEGLLSKTPIQPGLEGMLKHRSQFKRVLIFVVSPVSGLLNQFLGAIAIGYIAHVSQHRAFHVAIILDMVFFPFSHHSPSKTPCGESITSCSMVTIT